MVGILDPHQVGLGMNESALGGVQGVEIVLQSENSAFVLPDDLESLASLVRADEPNVVVRTVPGPTLFQESADLWPEVITVWVPTGVFYFDLLKAAIGWARDRYKQEWTGRRAKQIVIYGPDGRVLKAVQINDPHREPEDLTERLRRAESGRPPRLPPE